jgi:nucleoside-diphosphate kinase
MAIERTLILFKPDAVQRRLCGALLSRLEDKGLQIVGLKMLQVTPELARRHYAEHVSKPFYPLLEAFITSGPVVALVAQGPEAVSVVRTLMGPTNGRQAAPGTIRGDYGASRQMNLMHGSDGPEAAAKEIAVYFKPEELVAYEPTLGGWVCADDER